MRAAAVLRSFASHSCLSRYGRALASHILRKHQPALGPLRIYELGGGTGRAAYDVLSAIAVSNPAVYASLSYVSVEISAELAAKQAATCRPHAARFRVEHRDASTEWTPDATPCFVLGLEVLDNLPHDRVVRVDGQWHETRVLDNFEECLSPVADPLIARCLSHYRPSFLASRSGIVFLPTTALRLLEALQLARPNAHLLFADFDYLPGIRIPGVYAPLVASQRGGGTTTDHDSYLGSEPADVFFPTDFSMLQRIAGARGNVRKSAQFFEETLTGEELRQCSTASGFNPLLDDFPNTRFFTT